MTRSRFLSTRPLPGKPDRTRTRAMLFLCSLLCISCDNNIELDDPLTEPGRPPEGILYQTFETNRLTSTVLLDTNGANSRTIGMERTLFTHPTGGVAVYTTGTDVRVIDLATGAVKGSIPKPGGDVIYADAVDLAEDGEHVAFSLTSTNADPEPKVYVAKSDGSEIHALPINVYLAGTPRFASDNTHVAVVTRAEVESESPTLHIATVNGTIEESVPLTPYSSATLVGFSSDRDYIALLVTRRPEHGGVIQPVIETSTLVLLRRSDQTVIELDEVEMNGGLDYAWAPFVPSLAFANYSGNGKSGLFIGWPFTPLVQRVGDGSSPTWNPDQDALLFRSPEGSRFRPVIYSVRQKKIVQEIDIPEGHSTMSLEWSPNGSKFLTTEYDMASKNYSLVLYDYPALNRTILYTDEKPEGSVKAFWY